MIDAPYDPILQRRADHDLAQRSRATGLVYLALFSIIQAFSDYPADHPMVSLLAGGGIVLTAAIRTWLALKFDSRYRNDPGRWRVQFVVLTLVLGAVWGTFCAHSVLNYRLEWTSMLTLLGTAGISAGAITTLTMRKRLITVFLSLLLLPPTAAAALLQTQQSLAITLMFLTYCAFMFSIANRSNTAYWDALRNTVLLDHRAQELEASNRELESYSYSIAHDLRAPLRSIIGFSQILQAELRTRLSPSERSDFERVIRAGKRMATMIDEILELSRITRESFTPVDIDISALVSAQVSAIREHQDPHRDIDVQVQPGLRAVADPRLLDIAVQNLIDNALKFTAQNTRTEIRFRALSRANETVYCFSDNGVGFDMTYAEKLFRPFERLHSEATFPGTGVGLATVQRIIHRHGGEIWAEGSPGHGASFYFTL